MYAQDALFLLNRQDSSRFNLIALRIRAMYSAVRRFHSRGIRQSYASWWRSQGQSPRPDPGRRKSPGQQGNVDRNVSEPGSPFDHLVGADEERGQHEAKTLTCQVSSWISLTMDVIVQKKCGLSPFLIPAAYWAIPDAS